LLAIGDPIEVWKPEDEDGPELRMFGWIAQKYGRNCYLVEVTSHVWHDLEPVEIQVSENNGNTWGEQSREAND